MNLPKGLSKEIVNHFSFHQHYYIRDRRTNVPIATVAIGETKDNAFCRGIAICSDKDNFSKEEGRKLAYQRLLEADCRGYSSLPMDSNRASVEKLLYSHHLVAVFKSGYDIQLTVLERKIFGTKAATVQMS